MHCKKHAAQEHATSMDVHRDARSCAGVHEQLASCVQQIMVWLTPKGRLSLFQTSRQLARQVVRASHVTLQLRQEVPEDAVDARRVIISQLLDEGRKLKLVVEARGPQPFPLALSSEVTEVSLQYRQQGPASPWLEWSQFTGLQKLQLYDMISQADIDKLCSALVAGNLLQLQELLHFVDTRYLTLEAFMCGLGVRVKRLCTNSDRLLAHVQHLSALEDICLTHARVSSDTFMKLCDHPTLKTVQLAWWQHVSPDCSNRCCNWQSLHLLGTHDPQVLLHMPLANLKDISIVRRISVHNPEADLQGVGLLINRYLEKVELIPQWDDCFQTLCFKVENLTAGTIPIVSRLCTDCCLVVQRPPKDPAFLPALWAALHPSVSSVLLHGMQGVDWPNFWTGIPQSVKSVALYTWDDYSTLPAFTADILCHLITSTPLHVRRLKLGSQWKAASDKLVVPAHVTLVFP